MTVPARIQAGDTIAWVEPAAVDLAGAAATSPTWTLTVYLRFNAASEAATLTGTARADGGWDVTIPAVTTGGFVPGTWSWQTTITSAATVITIGTGSTLVAPSLAYAGNAAAFDGRSQARKDLEAVRTAIRAIVAKGARQYTIGTRSYTAQDLGQLMQREAELKAIVAREDAAQKVAAGLGDPRNLFVRFG